MSTSILPRNVIVARSSLLPRPPVHNLRSIHPRLYSTRASIYPRRPPRLWFLVGALGAATWLSLSFWEPTKSSTQLNPNVFSRYVIADRVPVSSTSSIFTLAPLEKSSFNSPAVETLFRENLWSVQIKQPQLQIAREYTPLPLDEVEKGQYGNEAFQLLIRREEQGEVSEWLHRLPIGTQIDIRGPGTVYKIPDEIEEILFLAGGTGIAPALQLGHALLASKIDSTTLPRLRILWANRRRDDCIGGTILKQQTGSSWFHWWPRLDPTDEVDDHGPRTSILVKQLNQLKSDFEGQLQVDYFVDEERSFITQGVLRSVLIPQQTPDFSSVTSSSAKRLILVSGPDGFVAYFAGAEGRSGKRETQGQLQGLLKDAGVRGWEVWKL